MRVASELPPPLRNTVFTVHEARHFGVSRGRLEASDLRRPFRGLYVSGACEPSEAHILSGLAKLHPRLVVSHNSAARIRDLAIPAVLRKRPELHVTGAFGEPPMRLAGVVCHRRRLLTGETEQLDHLPLTTRPRIWLDLAAHLSLEDLVGLGDQLIRIPRMRFEGRSEPWATRERLEELVAQHPNLQGVVRARQALALMRPGADSVPETKLRLALVAYGLPEPELQLHLDPGNRRSYSADMGYRRHRLAIHYEGAPHLDHVRQSSDFARDRAFSLEGWRSLRYNRNDLANGFSRACVEVSNELRLAAGNAI